MEEEVEQYRERSEDMKLAAMLWWQILWHASGGGINRIPSEHGWLSCELIAAIVKMTTGKQWWVSPRHNEAGERTHYFRAWHYHQWQPLDDQASFKEFGRWARVLELLSEFVRYDRNGDSQLKRFHENNALHNIGCSTFIPHQEILRLSKQYIENESGLSLWDQIAYGKACEKLGECMQPFIERDIAHIRNNYSW